MSKKEESFLRKLAQQERNRRWQAEYEEFTTTYNSDVEVAGLPLDPWRTF
ncbi:MAG: type II toxin-antitoxin system CcdA family antitoxin [Alcaligenaceae bacterium]|nr:type II toxin-antitoxin system CcdA family antitoxin [Alcaligenaceae bacterium]